MQPQQTTLENALPAIEKALGVRFEPVQGRVRRAIHPVTNWGLTIFLDEKALTLENVPIYETEYFSIDVKQIEMAALTYVTLQPKERPNTVKLINVEAQLILFHWGGVRFIPEVPSMISLQERGVELR